MSHFVVLQNVNQYGAKQTGLQIVGIELTTSEFSVVDFNHSTNTACTKLCEALYTYQFWEYKTFVVCSHITNEQKSYIIILCLCFVYH